MNAWNFQNNIMNNIKNTANRMNRLAITFFLLCSSTYISADENFIDTPKDNTVYKSVDKDGNVTYSTTPPIDASKSSEVKLDAPPSEERIKAAEQRHDNNLNAADIYDKNRKASDEYFEENKRQKRERQTQNQPEVIPNGYNQDYGYPYIPRRRPVARPIPLPATPRR